MKIKHINVVAKEWIHKIYGNVYFSALIYVDDRGPIYIEPQYGHGDHYLDVALGKLKELNFIPVDTGQLWRYCEDNNIKFNYNKWEVKRERDL